MFAHWGTGSGSAKLELVFPRNPHNLRKRLVSADLIALGEALPELLAIGPDEQAGPPVRRSARVWAAAAALSWLRELAAARSGPGPRRSLTRVRAAGGTGST